MWLGREDYTAEDWPSARADAEAAYDPRTTVRYLLGIPLLGDFLEEGLAVLGRACD
jgi:hypothetical protein